MMETSRLIQNVMRSAEHLLEHGVEEVRIPVLLYRDWLEFYGREDNAASRESRRTEQKQDWYLAHFLRKKKVDVQFLRISRKELFEALGELGPLNSYKDRRTALNQVARMGLGAPPPCRHIYEPGHDEMFSDRLGTVTLLGEPDQGPEIMSAVVHLQDGSPLVYENFLAIEYSPQQAREMSVSFFQKHEVVEVFTTPGVLRPEFCEDCGEILVKVADPVEVEQIMSGRTRGPAS